MTRLFRYVLALVLMFASTSALAGEQWVDARVTSFTCGYFNHQEAEVRLSYRNLDLPWGTSVYLLYGWGGYTGDSATGSFDWASTQTVEVPASSPYTWTTTVSSTVRARASTVYESINFVWKVVLPDGNVFYEKGNGSTYGYYAANFSALPVACTSDGSMVGTLQPLAITTVVKW
jgi:hypothetical protein